MTVGDTLLKGEVLDADRAREVYESIVRQRRDPGLLEYCGRGLFRARVWPIPPRGEITVRVIHACRELGLGSVAVYSDVDRRSPHVVLADEAVPLGGASAADSYLNVARILEAAARLVKAGGRLVYATCSILPEENEAVAAAFGPSASSDCAASSKANAPIPRDAPLRVWAATCQALPSSPPANASSCPTSARHWPSNRRRISSFRSRLPPV